MSWYAGSYLLAQCRILVFYFLWETKLIPNRCQFLWADSLQLYWQEPSEISAARRPASSLLTWFLTEFEIVALKWPHTHKTICSLRYWCTYLCSAVIWNIWLICWRNSWIVLIFQTSKYSCWTVNKPGVGGWGVGDWRFKCSILKWYLGFRSETENSFLFPFSFCSPKQDYLALETRLGKSVGIDLSVNYFGLSSQPAVITLYFYRS